MARLLEYGILGAVFVFSLAFLLCSAPGIGHYLSAHDPNFQLSLGRQFLFGKLPFIDYFVYYGPLVPLTSAAGLEFNYSMVPEVITCALGYSVALTLVFLLGCRCVTSPRYLKVAWGLGLYIVCLLLLARFHKWYLWMFPLLVLYLFDRFMRSSGMDRRWLLLTGLSVGVGWLYRFEVGLVCMGAIITGLFAIATKTADWKRFLKRLSVFLAALFLTMAPWFIALFSLGGFQACRDYIVATVEGMGGSFRHWGIPIPPFDWLAPSSLNSLHSLACYLMIFTYGLALTWMLRHVWLCRESEMQNRVFAFVVTLVATGLMPQGIYRADVSHFLQVMPLWLLTASLLVSQMWEAASSARTRGITLAARVALIVYMVLALVTLNGISPQSRIDMGPFGTDLLNRYRGLAKGVQALPDHPISLLVTRMKGVTAENAPVLILFEYMPHILSWAERPLSGIIPIYPHGTLDSFEWRMRNLKAVKADPPEIVVIQPNTFVPDPDCHSVCCRNPELCQYVTDHYHRVVYRQGDQFLVLAKDTE